MDAATENRPAGHSTAFLAGLQAGMLGALWMLAWLGINAKWQGRSFWTAENLFASGFYGGRAIRGEFAASTFCGIALYLVLYSLLGALFAIAVRDRLRPAGRALLSIVLALAWYYLSFHLIWKSLMPLVYLLHADRPTVLGHVIYGAILARFPAYFHPPQPAAPTPSAEPVQEPAPTETGSKTPEPL